VLRGGDGAGGHPAEERAGDPEHDKISRAETARRGRAEASGLDRERLEAVSGPAVPEYVARLTCPPLARALNATLPELQAVAPEAPPVELMTNDPVTRADFASPAIVMESP
jgi:hypothetical protein